MWRQGSNWVFNETVAIMNDRSKEAAYKGEKYPTPDFRGPIYHDAIADLPERLVETPYQVKKIAVRDACQALGVNKKMVKNGQKKFFELGFRSRKDTKQSIFVPGSAIKPTGIYISLLGEMRTAEPLPLDPKDSRIVFEHGRYYLCTPMEVEISSNETQAVAALDPGVRTFMSLFGLKDGCEVFGDYGVGCIRRIIRLCITADGMISQLKSLPTKARKSSLKRALARIKSKIQDLLAELHHQMAAWLCKNFQVIILPTFETSEMVRRGHRILRSKTVRAMLTLGHYRFKQHLKSVAARTGVTVIDANEAYTSKTNSWTGEIKKIGGAKYITVDGVKIKRDWNGSRGIFLRALGDKPATQPGSVLTISGDEGRSK